jgi:hypothetical protein
MDDEGAHMGMTDAAALRLLGGRSEVWRAEELRPLIAARVLSRLDARGYVEVRHSPAGFAPAHRSYVSPRWPADRHWFSPTLEPGLTGGWEELLKGGVGAATGPCTEVRLSGAGRAELERLSAVRGGTLFDDEIAELLDEIRYAESLLDRLVFRSDSWPILKALTASIGFRGAYIGENCERYIELARRHLANVARNELQAKAMEVVLAHPLLPEPPLPSDDPERDVRDGFRRWCIQVKRQGPSDHSEASQAVAGQAEFLEKNADAGAAAERQEDAGVAAQNQGDAGSAEAGGGWVSSSYLKDKCGLTTGQLRKAASRGMLQSKVRSRLRHYMLSEVRKIYPEETSGL